jgi:hypothetical protein
MYELVALMTLGNDALCKFENPRSDPRLGLAVFVKVVMITDPLAGAN